MFVIDSHTGGEPTRVIMEGGPELGDGPLKDRADLLARRQEGFYNSVMREPRGQTSMVGALLVDPVDPTCETGVIFFDAEAVLGMCGHGAIGLGVTLAHMGIIDIGSHKIETPVGIVSIYLRDKNTVTVTNVESRRVHKSVSLDVAGLGTVTGDVAYGGNWFFVIDPSPIAMTTKNIRKLTEAARAVRDAAIEKGLGGENGELINHVLFHEKHDDDDIHGTNFVLCSDDTYDRSPCGTGSCAILACLAADGALEPNTKIIQKSVIDSQFELSYLTGENGGVIPVITGSAHIMAESKLIFEDSDPFKNGIEY